MPILPIGRGAGGRVEQHGHRPVNVLARVGLNHPAPPVGVDRLGRQELARGHAEHECLEDPDLDPEHVARSGELAREERPRGLVM